MVKTGDRFTLKCPIYRCAPANSIETLCAWMNLDDFLEATRSAFKNKLHSNYLITAVMMNSVQATSMHDKCIALKNMTRTQQRLATLMRCNPQTSNIDLSKRRKNSSSFHYLMQEFISS
jgi:hypothetical protein